MITLTNLICLLKNYIRDARVYLIGLSLEWLHANYIISAQICQTFLGKKNIKKRIGKS